MCLEVYMKTKYVLIDRGDGYKRTAVTKRVAEDMIQRGTAKSYEPVTQAKIKAERMHIYTEADYFRHIAEDEFHTAYHNKQFKATVVSWDGTEGFINIHGIDDSIIAFRKIYACNIKGKKTWYPETACVYYNEGQEIDVELHVTHGFEIIVVGLTQGFFDEAKWNSLDKDRLAFKCDEQGNAINGLFK